MITKCTFLPSEPRLMCFWLSRKAPTFVVLRKRWESTLTR